MSKVNRNKRVFWVGYIDGKPDVEDIVDTYGPSRGVRIYTNRRDARKRYQDVRRIELPNQSNGGK